MSDQPETPPKQKPGSLRDRIAAFEKSAATTSPAPVPVPRPKPAGFANWKPKAPSPPSSPAASSDVSSTTSKAGGMSASDAKESITKGGSLKDRMAALQGKGAFGAPPPVAPKPALEKPKWKPPPVMAAPVEDKEGEGATHETEPIRSPPVSGSLAPVRESGVVKVAEEEGKSALAEEENQEDEPQEANPEEEERQRRAAIAARMAKLGGARLGMAPPVFGKKPTVKNSNPEPEPETLQGDVHKGPEASTGPSESSHETILKEDSTVASPPEISPEINKSRSPEYFPIRKDSESASLRSIESESQAAKSPGSMPVPAVPRRTAPPRRKAVKTPSSSDEKPEEVASPEIPGVVPRPLDSDTPESVPAEPIVEEAHEERESNREVEIEKDTRAGDTDETKSPISEGVKDVTVPLDVPSSEQANLSQEDEESVESSQPIARHTASDEELTSHIEPKVAHSPELVQAQASEETDEDDEEARRNRIAERLAKMGGVNPLASPPQRKPSASSSDNIQSPSTLTPTVSPGVKRGSIDSLEDPRRKESERKSSINAPIVEEPQVQRSPEILPSEESFDNVRHSSGKNSASSETKFDPLADEVPRGTAVDEPEKHEEKDEIQSRLSEPKAYHETNEYVDSGSVPSIKPSANVGERTKTLSRDLAESSKRAEFVRRPDSPHAQSFRRSYDQGQGIDEDRADRADDVEDEVEPLVVPAPHSQVSHHSDAMPTSPTRALPPPSAMDRAMPPRRVVPQAPAESDEEVDQDDDELLSKSTLYVLPPGLGHTTEKNEDPKSMRLREGYADTELDHDEDGISDGENAPLPVPHRRSLEAHAQDAGESVHEPKVAPPPPPRPGRPIPVPTRILPDDDEQASSDGDDGGEVLPTRIRGGLEENPRVIPPPTELRHIPEPVKKTVHAQPQPVRRSLPPAPTAAPVTSSSKSSSPGLPEQPSPSLLSPPLSVSDQEVLDDEEGDPIDPAFHSPSRRASTQNMRSSSPSRSLSELTSPEFPAEVTATASHPPSESVVPQELDSVDPEGTKRRTIAERMAKLGGIKFGAAPLPNFPNRPVPSPLPEEEIEQTAEDSKTDEETPEATEEREEQARKARIASKLAGMGGMRIGMMPLGMGGMPPRRSHVLKEETVSPPPPSRHLPSAQLQPREVDSEQGSANASEPEDGIKVEAEESEYEDVDEEEAIPPVPPRVARQASGSGSTHSRLSIDRPPLSPPLPMTRPPVPMAMPARKSSTSIQRKSTSDSIHGTPQPPQRKPPAPIHSHSEYVMVDEPQSLDEEEEAPPPPPRRVPPPAARTSQPPNLNDSISSQWELPSIPTSSLEFGSGADLSLSWSEDSQGPPSPQETQSTTMKSVPVSSPPIPSKGVEESNMSSDDLMAVWGRVGVQLCEVATALHEKSRRTLVGDGTYKGFVEAVMRGVPSARRSTSDSSSTSTGEWGYVVYAQNGTSVVKRASDIMPGDVVELADVRLKGHKGLQTYTQVVESAVGVISEFESKKSKVRVFQANQHVGQQTVEAVSYRLEDLKSGTVKVYRVLEA